MDCVAGIASTAAAARVTMGAKSDFFMGGSSLQDLCHGGFSYGTNREEAVPVYQAQKRRLADTADRCVLRNFNDGRRQRRWAMTPTPKPSKPMKKPPTRPPADDSVKPGPTDEHEGATDEQVG